MPGTSHVLRGGQPGLRQPGCRLPPQMLSCRRALRCRSRAGLPSPCRGAGVLKEKGRRRLVATPPCTLPGELGAGPRTPSSSGASGVQACSRAPRAVRGPPQTEARGRGVYSRLPRVDPWRPDSPVGGGGITPGSDAGPHGQSQPPTPGARPPAQGRPAGPGDGGRGRGTHGKAREPFGAVSRGAIFTLGEQTTSRHRGTTSAQWGHRRGARGSLSSLEGVSAWAALCLSRPPLPGPRGGWAGKACLCPWPVVAADTEGTVTCRGPRLSGLTDREPHAPQPGARSRASRGLGQPGVTPLGPPALGPSLTLSPIRPGSPGGPAGPGAPRAP